MYRIIKLKFGILDCFKKDYNEVQPYTTETSQVAIISPLLSNIAFDGLEKYLKKMVFIEF